MKFGLFSVKCQSIATNIIYYYVGYLVIFFSVEMGVGLQRRPELNTDCVRVGSFDVIGVFGVILVVPGSENHTPKQVLRFLIPL